MVVTRSHVLWSSKPNTVEKKTRGRNPVLRERGSRVLDYYSRACQQTGSPALYKTTETFQGYGFVQNRMMGMDEIMNVVEKMNEE